MLLYYGFEDVTSDFGDKEVEGTTGTDNSKLSSRIQGGYLDRKLGLRRCTGVFRRRDMANEAVKVYEDVVRSYQSL